MKKKSITYNLFKKVKWFLKYVRSQSKRSYQKVNREINTAVADFRISGIKKICYKKN